MVERIRWISGPMDQMGKWFNGSVTQLISSVVVQWYIGSVLHWFSDAWFSGLMDQ